MNLKLLQLLTIIFYPGIIKMGKGELVVKNLDYDYNWNDDILPVLRKINLEIIKGEFVCIIGPSGCGKSTLFNLIVGLENPSNGKIIYTGKNINGEKGYIAYMPQRDLLFPWYNLIENVSIGAKINNESLERVQKKAYKLLPLFELDGFAQARPSELSGGMRQRAALLRTVLLDKDIMALDEPFAALDDLNRKKMQAWLLKIREELKLTILFITHNIEEALFLADKIYVMSGRPGKIIETVKINLARPRDESTENFINKKAYLRSLLK